MQSTVDQQKNGVRIFILCTTQIPMFALDILMLNTVDVNPKKQWKINIDDYVDAFIQVRIFRLLISVIMIVIRLFFGHFYYHLVLPNFLVRWCTLIFIKYTHDFTLIGSFTLAMIRNMKHTSNFVNNDHI